MGCMQLRTLPLGLVLSCATVFGCTPSRPHPGTDAGMDGGGPTDATVVHDAACAPTEVVCHGLCVPRPADGGDPCAPAMCTAPLVSCGGGRRSPGEASSHSGTR